MFLIIHIIKDIVFAQIYEANILFPLLSIEIIILFLFYRKAWKRHNAYCTVLDSLFINDVKRFHF